MSGFPGHLFVIDGEPAAIRGSAATWAAFGAAALSARATLDQLDTSLFIGTEGDLWREGLNQDMPAHLATTGAAFTQVAGALTTFSDKLSTLQDLMRPIAGRAPALWEALQQATGALTDARAADTAHTAARQAATDARTDTDPPLPADTYQPRTGGAAAALSAAQRAWDDAVATAAGLVGQLTAASADATADINDAKSQRFTENPKWYDLGGQFTNFTRDHADALAKLSGALKIVSAVAGVLSFIPVLAPITAPIALATGAAALAIDGSLYAATGRGSLTGLLIDGALTVIPLGKLASLVRGATRIRTADGLVKLQDLGIRSRVVVRSNGRTLTQVLPRGTSLHYGGGGPARSAGSTPPRLDPRRSTAGYAADGVRVSRSSTQNALAERTVSRLERAGAEDIRVDQAQVAGGAKVGGNRPDVQATVGGQRIAVEYDVPSASGGTGARVPGHISTITTNDPGAVLITVPQP